MGRLGGSWGDGVVVDGNGGLCGRVVGCGLVLTGLRVKLYYTRMMCGTEGLKWLCGGCEGRVGGGVYGMDRDRVRGGSA
jgi:hypothetical protein